MADKSYVIFSQFWLGYLQFAEFDGSPHWCSSVRDAHVFTRLEATKQVAYLPLEWDAQVVEDYHQRVPMVMPEVRPVLKPARTA